MTKGPHALPAASWQAGMQEGAERSSPTGELSARAAQPAGRPQCVCNGGSGLGPKGTCSVPSIDGLALGIGLSCELVYLWQCMAICCKEQLIGARGRKPERVLFWAGNFQNKAPTHLRGLFFFSAP
jgi:hypothetical protein